MKNFFNNYFSPMDIHFSRFIASFTQQNKEDLSLAAALVSRYVRDGHICLDLNDIAGKIIFKSEDGKNIIECPQLQIWLASLKLASCVGASGDFKPLILDEKGRLYLQRYWQYEKDVAEYVSASISKTNEIKLDKVKLQKKLNLYFDESSKQKINWQKVAAIAALPPEASLILLGDKDQLASVEVGAVLGDICGQGAPDIFSPEFARQIALLSGEVIESDNVPARIQDNIIYFQKNCRFSDQSGIGLLGQTVKNGQYQEAAELLRSEKYADVHWTELSEGEKLFKHFGEIVIERYQEYLKAAKSGNGIPDNIFDLFEKIRILCALRVGIWGTERMNISVEKILRDTGLIKPQDIFYEGMPIMVLQNDYRLRLFNGDVGIILKDAEENDQLRAFFRDEHNSLRKYLPARLPQYETVWAMTVHKSQGSEFERVLLVLSNSDIPLITRELIYTGITRARRDVDIWASEDLLKRAISRRISRQFGLADALQNSPQKTLSNSNLIQ